MLSGLYIDRAQKRLDEEVTDDPIVEADLRASLATQCHAMGLYEQCYEVYKQLIPHYDVDDDYEKLSQAYQHLHEVPTRARAIARAIARCAQCVVLRGAPCVCVRVRACARCSTSC